MEAQVANSEGICRDRVGSLKGAVRLASILFVVVVVVVVVVGSKEQSRHRPVLESTRRKGLSGKLQVKTQRDVMD